MQLYLEGKAENVINGLPTTNKSYGATIDLLKQRFGQTALIINNHMSKLLNLQKVESCDDLGGLQKMHEEVQAHLQSLKSLRVDVEAHGVLLKTSLLCALPNELVLKYNQHLQRERRDDLSSFLHILKMEIRSRESAWMVTSSDKHPPFNPTQRIQNSV